MSASWAIVVGVVAALAVTCFGDLVSEEIRGRLDLLPRALIRLAARRVPEDMRDDLRDDWLAELEVFLHGKEALPVTRLLRGVGFALGLVRTARGIGRDLGAKEPINGQQSITDSLWDGAAPEDWAAFGVDVSRPSMARMYDFLLGGKHNFAADCAAAAIAIEADRDVPRAAWENRAFLGRAVRFAVETGIRQFIDLGTGLPTEGHVHEVVQSLAPDSRVIYVDNDPMVLRQAQALVPCSDTIKVIGADIREPEAMLKHPSTRSLIDFDEPVAVLMLAVLHFFTDDEARRVIDAFRDVTAPSSLLLLSQSTEEGHPELHGRVVNAWKNVTSTVSRSRTEVETLFRGFEILEPGVVWAPQWRPDIPDPQHTRWAYAGVGMKN